MQERRSTACTRPRSASSCADGTSSPACCARRGRERRPTRSGSSGSRRWPPGPSTSWPVARRCACAACSRPGSGCARRTRSSWRADRPRRWIARGATSVRRSRSSQAPRARCSTRRDIRPRRRVLDRVRETLHAAVVDEAVGERVRAGRLEKEEQATGFVVTGLPAGEGRKPAKTAAARRRATHEAARGGDAPAGGPRGTRRSRARGEGAAARARRCRARGGDAARGGRARGADLERAR